MYYKIKRGTPLFKKLDEMSKEMRRCNRIAFKLIESLGAEQFRIAKDSCAGGISCIAFPEKPLGYKKVMDGYMPTKKLQNIQEKIGALPTVPKYRINEVLGFESQTIGNKWFASPGAYFRKNVILIDMDDSTTYKKKRGMTEITYTEFKRLSK